MDEVSLVPCIEYSDANVLVRQPFVSICMITYNHTAYISAAIAGVLSQQLPYSFELIIGEDCSKDGTRGIVLEYQRRYPRVIRILTSAQNVGMLANHYRAIAAARGKYVAFCEGDDLWHRPDKLTKQIAILEADPNVSLVGSSYRRMSNDGQVIKEDRMRGLQAYDEYLSYDDLVLDKVFIPTVTACARRDLLFAILEDSEQCRDKTFLMGDLPLWLELSQRGKVRFIPEPLASYRHSVNSATRQRDPLAARRFAMSACEISYQMLSKYNLTSGSVETQRHQVRLARCQLKGAVQVGDRKIARLQVPRLRRLQGRLSALDAIFYCVAHAPFPRRFLAYAVRAMQRFWHGNLRKPDLKTVVTDNDSVDR